MDAGWRSVWALVALLALAAATIGSAVAEPVADFYRGKTITIIVGYAPGGLYDIMARLLARHLGAHVPGEPAIVVQNVPGSSSITAIMRLYVRSPRDGTELGMVSRGYAIDPLYNPASPKYEPQRFNPIGSPTSEVEVAVTWYTTPVKTFGDLFTPEVAKRGITVGATGVLDDTGRMALLMKNLTGANIKVVTGYPGGNDVTMAMEEGEVDGRFGWSWGAVKSRSRPWLEQKKINIIFQMGMKKAPDLPDTPFIMDYAKTEQDRQALDLLFAPQAFAWPLIGPPGLPADRLAALRAAFDATMKDPAFLADAAKLHIDIDPMGGAEIQTLIARVLAYDPAIVARAATLTAPH